ncbi:hypothetical protein FGRA07_06868 [Fusarium graminearum]|nr:hypothetical protein FGRA07_06868 [Fusarium graminearum]
MFPSLFFTSILAAGISAQSIPDPALTANRAFQHLGCVAIRPGTFPRQFNLGQTGCASTCSSNGNIIGFRGNSCVCDRLDLSDRPITYRVVKVDNALCTQWCDPADKSKGTCGGASVQGWPIYDLYKRNNAQIVYENFPSATPTPMSSAYPVQTGGPKPGDVWHECPPHVVNCPYRNKCPSGNCHPVHKPIVKPCYGCSHNGTGSGGDGSSGNSSDGQNGSDGNGNGNGGDTPPVIVNSAIKIQSASFISFFLTFSLTFILL